MSLTRYTQKRDFKKTKEPVGKLKKTKGSLFVVQKHHASHLHYDFRLELDGVLVSWAVPKGPTLDPHQKRLAVRVEDHPVSYGDFEGEIPAHEYGGGVVIVWDTGSWKATGASPKADLKKGRLEFELHGEKLKGKWILVRTRGAESKSWLLMKRTDPFARSGEEVIDSEPNSVLSERSIEDLEDGDVPVRKGARKAATKTEQRLSAARAGTKPARKAKAESDAMPEFQEPELALLAESVPVGDDWIHELKFDGYRTLVRVQDGETQMLTRTGLDWTKKYGALAGEFQALKAKRMILDGEIVVVDGEGRSQFHMLQEALKAGESKPLLFYAFDLLYLEGKDLRDRPLFDRKTRLKTLIETSKSKKILFSEQFSDGGKALLQQSCQMDLEGIVSKRRDSLYESGRGGNWLKIKCGHNDEFVIAGFTEPRGSRGGFGALVLGVFENGNLHYAGRVGTGFNEKSLKELKTRFSKLVVEESPFSEKVPDEKIITWIQPKLVAQIQFTGFTSDGLIRHGSFVDLREDKPATQVESPRVEARKASKKASLKTTRKSNVENKTDLEGVKLSHPDRLLFPKSASGITKRDLAEFYVAAAPRMLEYLADRPLSLLRCPEGEMGQCFFQKHLSSTHDESIHHQKVKLKERGESKSEEILYVDSARGLASLVQMGVVDVHCWGSKREAVERADSVIFDLDPGEQVEWLQVIDGAFAIRELMQRLKLESFLKVSGGKGLHVHVPIEPDYTWEQVKLFTKTIAENLSRKYPKLYTSAIAKKARGGKIFIDYLRNGYGATAVAPYSVRARTGAPIALPIPWKDLNARLKPDQFRLGDGASVLQTYKKDPWAGYEKSHREVSLLDQFAEG